MKYITTTILTVLSLLAARSGAQTPAVPTPAEIAKALGFTTAEIAQIEGGEIVNKALNEGSAKELAGVVAVFFKKPVGELAEMALQGKTLESDKTIQAFRVWKPDGPVDEAFAALGLGAAESDEAKIFSRASAGSKLNLSATEVAQFRQAGPAPTAISAELRAMLKARYEAYRKSGLNGIALYARDDRKTASPAQELTLAIKETMTAVRLPEYFQALLDYPAQPLPDVEHRFYWFKREVENRPTFMLSHRASRRGANAALMTEVEYYVGHSFNSNFIVAGGLAVQGGTLVFYVNRTFTDQVAGFASGVKHKVGRGQMLSAVAENLKRVRDQLQK